MQLLLTLPVLLWVGWPTHSIGWRALRDRSAEMNSLMILGTTARPGSALTEAVPPRYRMLILLAAWSGARWAELVALSRDRLDPNTGP